MTERHLEQSDDPYQLANPLEFFWSDYTKLISDAKTRCWEVLKWAVTANLALSAFYVSVAAGLRSGSPTNQVSDPQLGPLLVSAVILVTFVSWIFIYIQICENAGRRRQLKRMIEAKLDPHSKSVFEFLYGELPSQSGSLSRLFGRRGAYRNWLEVLLYFLVILASASPAIYLPAA